MSTVPSELLASKFREHGFDEVEVERAVPGQDAWDFIGNVWDSLFGWQWSEHPDLKEHTEELKWDNLPADSQVHFFYDTAPIVQELGDGIAHVIVKDLAEQLGLPAEEEVPSEGLNVAQMLEQLQALGIDVTEFDLDTIGANEQKGMFN